VPLGKTVCPEKSLLRRCLEKTSAAEVKTPKCSSKGAPKRTKKEGDANHATLVQNVGRALPATLGRRPEKTSEKKRKRGGDKKVECGGWGFKEKTS